MRPPGPEADTAGSIQRPQVLALTEDIFLVPQLEDAARAAGFELHVIARPEELGAQGTPAPAARSLDGTVGGPGWCSGAATGRATPGPDRRRRDQSGHPLGPLDFRAQVRIGDAPNSGPGLRPACRRRIVGGSHAQRRRPCPVARGVSVRPVPLDRDLCLQTRRRRVGSGLPGAAVRPRPAGPRPAQSGRVL